jgi:hypothetical protein
MSLKANCPSCGGAITFAVGTSLVAVCPYCRSAVGRGDKGLEDLGKVADLVETRSPLDVGVKGRFDGVPFSLTGRTQYRHPAGGVWDEWYAAFTDGKWGWLAEAQGRFYLTFEAPPPADLPSFDALQLGQVLAVNDTLSLLVAEKATARVGGAAGEVPERIRPNQEHPFADLSGPRGEFATIDYSGPQPALYLGRQVTLDELGVPPKARRTFPGMEPKIEAVQLSCPNCAGPLALRAPDKSERVGCPNCGSLLDVQEGKLKLLQSLNPPEVQPVIPLGAEGKYQGVEWTCIGFMQRYVTLEGTDYAWEEYLVYQPRLGFRWLTRSDGHWSWVETVPPAAVALSGNNATYAGRTLSLFQVATAKVRFVVGEFYWKVKAGETVESRDFVSAPWIVSEEVTREGKEGEINYSVGHYLQPGEVEAMFGLQAKLPAPTTVGPNQPFPYTAVYRSFLYLLLAALVIAFFLWLISADREVFSQTYTFAALPKDQKSATRLSDKPIELRGRRNVRVVLEPQGPGWTHLEGELVSSDTRRPLSLLTTDGQPAWAYLSAVPAGQYDLRLTFAWQSPESPASATVRLEEGVAHPWPLFMTLLLLGVVPLATALYQLYFESKRWADSNVQSGGGEAPKEEG